MSVASADSARHEKSPKMLFQLCRAGASFSLGRVCSRATRPNDKLVKTPTLTSDMDHSVTVRANERQLIERRPLCGGPAGKRTKVMNVDKPLPNLTIGRKEVEAAAGDFAAQPPRVASECLLDLPLPKCGITGSFSCQQLVQLTLEFTIRQTRVSANSPASPSVSVGPAKNTDRIYHLLPERQFVLCSRVQVAPEENV